MKPLGIGVITYSRLPFLNECVSRVQTYCGAPYVLVIADDGSADGSIEWGRSRRIPVVTGPNRGCAWNKNRALYTLMGWTDCDPILLLEDDCWPAQEGWAEIWRDAALGWGHINFCLPGTEAYIYGGEGTAESPNWSRWFTGQCTASSRAALERVGYLDTRFQGFGYEHVEWTARFGRAGFLAAQHGFCIQGGLVSRPGPSFAHQGQLARNLQTWRAIARESVYRDPWHTDAERLQLQAEVRSGWDERTASPRQSPVPATSADVSVLEGAVPDAHP